MGGHICTGKPVLVNWGCMPAVDLVTGRLRPKQIFEASVKYCSHRYEINIQPGVLKGAVYILRVYCYVTSGKTVLLEF